MAANKKDAADLFRQIQTDPRGQAETRAEADRRDPPEPQWSHTPDDRLDDQLWNTRFGSLLSWDKVESLIQRRGATRAQYHSHISAGTGQWVLPEPRKRKIAGQVDHYEYVPAWSDPDYESEERKAARTTASFIGRQVPGKGDRPQSVEPTQFAKKYGVYPGRDDGRSLLSPKNATVKLDNNKAFWFKKKWQREVNKEALAHVRRAIFEPQRDPSSRHVGDNREFRSFLEANSQTVARGIRHTKQPGAYPPELFKACLEYHTNLKDNNIPRDYQRYMFSGFDVDELIDHGLFDFNNDVSSELNVLELHGLLLREKWKTLHPIAAPRDQPRQYWRFLDKNGNVNEGEWTASDDRVWTALKPALQVVSYIFEIDPPAWKGLRNLYTRFQIDPRRDPWNSVLSTQIPPSAFQGRVGWEAFPNDDRSRFPGLAALHAAGINLTKGVEEIFKFCLRLSIGSCHRGKNLPPHLREPAHGMSYIHENGPALKDTEIRIVIGAELLWPLLSPDTTESEKLSCSFAVACTLLHEFAHGVELACSLLPKHTGAIPGLFPAETAHLAALGDTLFGQNMEPIAGWTKDDFYQPFFEDEPVAEPGHALVNDIFGGIVNKLQPYLSAPMPESLNLAMTDLVSEQWPPTLTRPWLRSTEFNPILLSNPQLSFADMHTALPFKSYLKYFQRSFWEHEWPTWGYEALKVYSEGDLHTRATGAPKATVEPVSVPEDLLKSTFGVHRGTFISHALDILDKFGYRDMTQHLKFLLRVRLCQEYTKRRWHVERRTWPQMRNEMDDLAKELQKAGAEFLTPFEAARGSEEDLEKWYQGKVDAGEINPQDDIDHKTRAEMCCEKQYKALLAKLRKFERLCTTRLCYFQYLAREYITLTEDQREVLDQRHGVQIHKEINCGVTYVCKGAKLAVDALVEQMRSHDPIGDVPVGDLEARSRRLETMMQLLIKTKHVFMAKRNPQQVASQWPVFTTINIWPNTPIDWRRLAAVQDCERLADPYLILIAQELRNLIGSQAGLGLTALRPAELRVAERAMQEGKLLSEDTGDDAETPSPTYSDTEDQSAVNADETQGPDPANTAGQGSSSATTTPDAAATTTNPTSTSALNPAAPVFTSFAATFNPILQAVDPYMQAFNPFANYFGPGGYPAPDAPPAARNDPMDLDDEWLNPDFLPDE
ncbi:hypothetical protein MCOR27_002020 [Pyricularia oryzae]|uniref:Uncharacterized protein n=1 Tax=Pyricularia grisea TaxID=148305 RepID=A0ABQ8NCX4_PYRGI|nr:hypothetical protein MCOR01_002696 [Pyricularia oryzae]KAI6295019.1 hypothetical protein MCOR33_007967 [Pyricularia grisea]KAI6286002.1 hypothetical protein MCOR27_002020 [Pyricularia oryzae]KAI6337899.1 hypothetical protein MCOR30_003242 [Pyricularia oryzae]KAI6368532.1 hypothetical protein MCOR31_005561 [Pyricularia oryzae]